MRPETRMPTGLFAQAEALADIIVELAQRPTNRVASGRKPILKLPPVFTAKSDERYGHGRTNLVAMIKAMAEYEDGYPDGSHPTLADLPSRYNHHGGLPKLNEQNMRKVHNWLQQVSFAVRAAVIEQEERHPTRGWESLSVPERVARRLFSSMDTRRVFVAHPPGSLYEFKPLRYASRDAILNWIGQECAQKRVGAARYGAQPTGAEWDAYGLRGQAKSVCAELKSDIDNLVQLASKLDSLGEFRAADEVTAKLIKLQSHLEALTA